MPTMFACFTAARNWRSATAAAAAASSLVFKQPLEHHPAIQHVVFAEVSQPNPPKARQPLTSYWSATTSPGLSEGTKEYGVPQAGQNPASRRVKGVGLPWASWQSGIAQNRLCGGTWGLAMITFRVDCWQFGHGHHSQPEMFPRTGPGTAP